MALLWRRIWGAASSQWREGTVSIFDIKTLATSSKVKVGDNPDAILYDRRRSGYSRLTDAARIRRQSTRQRKSSGDIKLDGKPEFACQRRQGRDLRSTSRTRANWWRFDPNKLEVKAKWPLAPCTEAEWTGD